MRSAKFIRNWLWVCSFGTSAASSRSQKKDTSRGRPSASACSKPPLSQLIKAIERELGAQLLLRKARGVELTEAGRVFLDNARTLLAQYDRTFESTRRAARGEQGHLCVGVMPTAPFHPFVPTVIRAFRAAFPLVSLTLDECLRREALERLQNDRMDAAFLRAPLSETRELVAIRCWKSRWWWRYRPITHWPELAARRSH